MTISYTLDRKEAAKGISRSQAHRTPIRRFLLPTIGLIFLAYSSKYLFFDKSGSSTFGVILFLLGTFYIMLPAILLRRAAKNMFAGRSGDMAVKAITSDEGIEMITEGSSGTTSWTSFVDFRICTDGILLYPQKMIQYWIPSSASIENGTWQDFEAIVSGKVQRKI
jgi:hypothetical protein